MSVPDTPIAANFNKAFDIKVNLFSEFTLNPVLTVNNLPDTIKLVFGKLIRFNIRVDSSLS